MSAQTPQTGEPGLFRRILSAPKKLSHAAAASIALGVFLAATVGVIWSAFFLNSEHVPWQHAFTLPYALTVIALVLLIPVVTYYALRLWLIGERSKHPDIDFAWNEGLRALERGGISIRSTPVFLILGAGSEPHQKAIIDASYTNLPVHRAPDGSAALHWSANSEGIFLFCTAVGWLSALGARKHSPDDDEWSEPPAVAAPKLSSPNPEPASGRGSAETPDKTIYATAMAGAPNLASPVVRPTAPANRETVDINTYKRELEATARAKTGTKQNEAQETPSLATVRERSEGLDAPGAKTLPRPSPSPRSARTTGRRESPPLVSRESARQVERLRYVCRLLRQVRQPLCAINGVTTLLPLPHIDASTSREFEESRRAIRTDLLTIQDELRIRCPVIALVVDMEREPGFRELAKRMGSRLVVERRFGHRFNLGAVATPEAIKDIADHLGGQFEDFVYELFEMKRALTEKHNTHLFGLLCKVRCYWKGRLREILEAALCGDAAADESATNRPLFSGAYFAATGAAADQQAFVKAVVEKMVAEQDQVEWTPAARTADTRYRWAAAVMFVIDLALVALIAVQFLRP